MNMIQEFIAKVENDIKALEDRMAAPVLDGTPFLLTLNPATGTMIYGEWDNGRGFRHIDTVPDHLCGAVQMSEESVNRNVATLKANLVPRAMHVRDFQKARLAHLHSVQGMLLRALSAPEVKI